MTVLKTLRWNSGGVERTLESASANRGHEYVQCSEAEGPNGSAQSILTVIHACLVLDVAQIARGKSTAAPEQVVIYMSDEVKSA